MKLLAEPKPDTDATGRWIYEAQCKNKGTNMGQSRGVKIPVKSGTRAYRYQGYIKVPDGICGIFMYF